MQAARVDMHTWVGWVHPKLVPHGLSQDGVSRSIVVPVDDVVSYNLIGPLVHERVADDGSSSCTTHMHCSVPVISVLAVCSVCGRVSSELAVQQYETQ